MNPCQNCGKVNTPEANFCRFCGTKFRSHVPVASNNPYDHAAPPRPYSWKTDEFQTQNEQRPTMPVSPQQPANRFDHAQHGYSPAPLMYQQHQPIMQPFQCPRCMSKYVPRIERRISTAGWITFAVLLVFFFPLFWIGLLIKEDAVVCQTCNLRVS